MFNTAWKARKYFKFPKLKLFIGKLSMGLPINNYDDYYNWTCIQKYIYIWCSDVIWKDKFDDPRFEYPPQLNIILFWRWQILLWLDYSNEKTWEQLLWYLYYFNSKKDEYEELKKSYPWVNCETKKSSWDETDIKDKWKKK